MFRAVTGRASEQAVLRATVSGGGAVQGAETAPWPWGPAPRWQSRPHLRPASVPTSSRAQVPSLAWRAGLFWTPFRGSDQLLVTQGPGPGLLRNSRGVGERLMQSHCSQARASRQPQSRQRVCPAPSVCPRRPAGSQTRTACASGLSGTTCPQALLIRCFSRPL